MGNQEFIFFNKEDVEVIFGRFRSDPEIDFAKNYAKRVRETGYPKLSIR